MVFLYRFMYRIIYSSIHDAHFKIAMEMERGMFYFIFFFYFSLEEKKKTLNWNFLYIICLFPNFHQIFLFKLPKVQIVKLIIIFFYNIFVTWEWNSTNPIELCWLWFLFKFLVQPKTWEMTKVKHEIYIFPFSYKFI